MTIIGGPLKCITPHTNTHYGICVVKLQKKCVKYDPFGGLRIKNQKEKLLAYEKIYEIVYMMEYYTALKREGNLVIHDCMDGSEGHYAT
jgi:hypothetical protein